MLDFYDAPDFIKTQARNVFFQTGLIKNIKDIIGDAQTAIICDTNTVTLLPQSLKSQDKIKLIILKNPLPQELICDHISSKTKDCELIVAVGSGVITDLCKYTSHKTQKRCILFPTAPSVNAYTSPNASVIGLNGKKSSKKAKIPEAIYVDTKVISQSPKRLILSGLYDFLCEQTVNVDMLCSCLAKGTYYNADIFQNTARQKNDLMQHITKLLMGDKTLCIMLFKCLLNSGFWMQRCGNTASASQSEHILAHIFESQYKQKYLHGECVATGVIIASFIQQKIFYKKALEISKKKLNNYLIHKKSNIKKRNLEQRLKDNFDHLRYLTRDHAKLRSFIAKTYTRLPKIQSIDVFKNAFLFRDRFTCLDLAFLSKFFI